MLHFKRIILINDTDGLLVAPSLTPRLLQNASRTNGISARNIRSLYGPGIAVLGSPIGLFPTAQVTSSTTSFVILRPATPYRGEKHAYWAIRLVLLRFRIVSCETRDVVIDASATCAPPASQDYKYGCLRPRIDSAFAPPIVVDNRHGRLCTQRSHVQQLV